MCDSGGFDGDDDETEEKDRDRRLTAEESHAGNELWARFTEERRTRRRRVADIVSVETEEEVDGRSLYKSPVCPFLLQIG